MLTSSNMKSTIMRNISTGSPRMGGVFTVRVASVLEQVSSAGDSGRVFFTIGALPGLVFLGRLFLQAFVGRDFVERRTRLRTGISPLSVSAVRCTVRAVFFIEQVSI